MALIPDIWRDVGTLTGPVDFTVWFGNDRPVEIEIGCGKGAFLAASAQLRPEVNFLGVERDGRYLKFAREKMEDRGLANVRLIHGDMVYFLLNHIRAQSVSAYHVYFPDPWPKRRHAKRRMFREVSVGQFERTLAPGGRLFVKTDVPVNFTRIRRTVNDSELFDLEEMRVWGGREGAAGPPPEGNVATNFEIKYARVGKEVFYARWRVKT